MGIILHNAFSWHSDRAWLWRLTGLFSACEWGQWALFAMNLGRELLHSRKGCLKQGERPLWCFFSISKQSLWGKKNYLEPQQWFWRQLGKAAKLSTAMCQAEGWNLNPGPIIPTTVSRSTSQGTKWEIAFQKIQEAGTYNRKMKKSHWDVVVDIVWFITGFVFQDVIDNLHELNILKIHKDEPCCKGEKCLFVSMDETIISINTFSSHRVPMIKSDCSSRLW